MWSEAIIGEERAGREKEGEERSSRKLEEMVNEKGGRQSRIRKGKQIEEDGAIERATIKKRNIGKK